VADQGAQQIRNLLETSSDTLEAAMEKVGDGLTLQDADSEVGRAAFQGITQARNYYGGLARRIRRTPTSADAKADVLDAISRMNGGLTLFAKGLKAGSDTDEGVDQINEGAARMQEAARDLTRATNALT
jgi:hypothetical protein